MTKKPGSISANVMLDGPVADAIQALDLRRQAQIGNQRRAISRLLTDPSGGMALAEALAGLAKRDEYITWLEMYLQERGLGKEYQAWAADRRAALGPVGGDLPDSNTPTSTEEQP